MNKGEKVNRIQSKLESWSKDELNILAKKFKIKGFRSKNRDDLITGIIENIPLSKLNRSLFPTRWEQYQNSIFGWASIIGLIIGIVTYMISFNSASYESLYPKSQKSFDPDDNVNLKIALFPFKPDIECTELAVDYRSQILERLESKKKNEGLLIKILPLEGNNIECPVTDSQAKELGEQFYADLVIWGSYEENTEGTKGIRIRYTFLKDFELDSLLEYGDSEMQDLNSLSQLRQGYLQQNIDYSINWVEGITAYRNHSYEKALNCFIELTKDSLEQHFALDTYILLSKIFIRLGRFNRALEYSELVMINTKEVLDTTGFEYSEALTNKGEVLMELGRIEEGLDLYKRGLIIRENLFEEKNPYVAESYNNIGVAYNKMGNYSDALYWHKKAVEIRETLYNKFNPTLAISYNNIAVVYQKLRMFDKAIEYDKKAILIREKILPPNHPSLATSYNNLAVSLKNNGDPMEAIKYLEISLSIQEKIYDDLHPELAAAYNNLATSYDKIGVFDKALLNFDKTLLIFNNIHDSVHLYISITHNNIANVYLKKEEFELALKNNNRAIEIFNRLPTKDSITFAAFINNKGLTLRKSGNNQDALKYFQDAIDIYHNRSMESHSNMVNFYENISVTYRDLGQVNIALSFITKAKDIAIVKFKEGSPQLKKTLNYFNEIDSLSNYD